uniref:Dihydrolipoamide acetyltransferase component of pyruvate dehydrogenase complex n=1 Tax=Globisporangium ultimum (strain ATCC 200006 / CBS 805.95 / DAOM BR144) TaxID=431595 RepID=K3WYH9_GLOUD
MSFQVLGRSVRARGRYVARRVEATAATAAQSAARGQVSASTTRAFSALQTVAMPVRSFQPQRMVRSFSAAAAEPVPVPSMGDSISEGTVVEWLKAPGDYVEVDEVVVVLETDKVSVDVRAPFAGVLDAQLAKIDENVLVGAPLFSVIKQTGDAPAAAAATAPAPAAPVTETKAPAVAALSAVEDLETVNVPSMGDSISEGTVVTIFKNVGDYVNADEPVLIVETDKVSVDVNAPFAGKVTSVLTKLDEVVQVGAPLFVLDKAAAAPAAAAVSTPAATEAKPVAAAASTPVPAAKAASPAAPAKAAAPAAAASAPVSTGRYSRNETRVQMSALKVRAAQRQKDTQNSAAMLSTFQECDLGNLIAFRDELGETFEKTHGVKLGFMSAFLKASALALQKVPAVNSFIDMDEKEIVYNDFVDINVAVASERGVVVPVIRNVEKLGLADLEKSLASLGEQARDGTLAVEDLAGGTFTISNSGVQGSLLSTSMLTAPQSAILGVHGVKLRPSLHEGKIVPRPMMFLSLTYDHRIIDGREGVTFLKSIAESVSDPRRLLLEL